MDFIRPELRAALRRWREALAGGAVAGFGLWAVLGPGGLVGIVGAAACVISLPLIWTGVQKGRFRGAGQGPGSVDVDEGQITYFGPLTGGAIAVREVRALVLVRAHGQSPHWRLSSEEGDLHIPVDADGADALFDAFSTLPGLRTERMVSALKDGTREDVVIWQRPALRAVR